jgi:membrane associated rhomboid family serine protease
VDRWPAGSRPPVFRPPVVTYALIAVNVLMWLLTGLLGPGDWLQQLAEPDRGTLILMGAKYGPAIHAGEYWRLVTATFLHAGIFHLAVNMWALLQLGMLCEILYGRARFLILYVCSGVIGSLASYELSPIMGVGASGAIFGLFGVAVVYSLKYRRELPRGMGDRMLRSLVPVILLNLVITFAFPIIDKFAHLGGLIAGGLLAAITESPTASPERREHENLPVPVALLTAIGLLAYGAWGLSMNLPLAVAFRVAAAARQPARAEAAIRALRRATSRHPEEIGAQLALLSFLEQKRRWPEAVQAYLALSRSTLPPDETYNLGVELAQVLDQLHQGPEAELVYRRLLELNPEDSQVLNGLAYLYADVLDSHLDEAERMARKALQAAPNDPMITDTLAWIYFKQGKLGDAYAQQRQAIQLADSHTWLRYPSAAMADLHYHMGAINEGRGDLAGARSEYETALRLDPNQAQARQALAKLNARPAAGGTPAR